MTTDEAILRIQDHIRAHKIGENRHVYIGEALDVAIAALHEKQERDKGCEYCDFSSGDVGAVLDNVGDSFVMVKSEDGVSIATDDAAFKLLHVNYCPMCGRKLEENKE